MMSLINPLDQTLCSYPAIGPSAFQNTFNKCKKELFERTISTEHSKRSELCILSSLFNDFISDQSVSEQVANATINAKIQHMSFTYGMNSCEVFSKKFNSVIENVKEKIPLTDKIVEAVSSIIGTANYEAHNPEYQKMISDEYRKFPDIMAKERRRQVDELRSRFDALSRQFDENNTKITLANVKLIGCGIVLVGIALVLIKLTRSSAPAPLPPAPAAALLPPVPVPAA